MSILRFFTDPHVGKELKANTTPASRSLLAKQLHLHAIQAATMPHPEDRKVEATICGGDLFDTDSNPEFVLLAGAHVAEKCDLVIGGNHDVINVADRTSSLHALSVLTTDQRFVLPPEPGKVSVHRRGYGPAGLHAIELFTVPHHARQQEFEEALEQARQQAEACPAERKLLLVHCNYHLTFEAGENDLNLTDAKARHLLQVFDYIVMGHDHRPRRECDGRLIVLGNTHPTSFSDQGVKYTWFYDSQTNDWTQVVNASDESMQVKASELIADWKTESLHRYEGVEWLDIVGSLPPEAAVDLAKAIRELWRKGGYLYAIRASKVLFIAEGENNDQPVGAAQKTLIEIVEDQLASSPDLLALFREAKDMKE